MTASTEIEFNIRQKSLAYLLKLEQLGLPVTQEDYTYSIYKRYEPLSTTEQLIAEYGSWDMVLRVAGVKHLPGECVVRYSYEQCVEALNDAMLATGSRDICVRMYNDFWECHMGLPSVWEIESFGVTWEDIVKATGIRPELNFSFDVVPSREMPFTPDDLMEMLQYYADKAEYLQKALTNNEIEDRYYWSVLAELDATLESCALVQQALQKEMHLQASGLSGLVALSEKDETSVDAVDEHSSSS